jgi:F0F1-type ATP synthase assembly protein I
MAPARTPTFAPAQAGALLSVVTLLGVGVGALLGWALGSASTGLVIGAVLGLPAGVAAVYQRYHGYFS